MGAPIWPLDTDYPGKVSASVIVSEEKNFLCGEAWLRMPRGLPWSILDDSRMRRKIVEKSANSVGFSNAVFRRFLLQYT